MASIAKAPPKKAKEPKFEAPQVDFLKTGRDALTLAGEAYPYFLDLNQKYGADFARNEVDVAGARSQAEQNVIGQQGLNLRSTLLGASPEISTATGTVMDSLNATGPSAIENELRSQALGDLRLGGTLSNEDTRAAVQQARAGSSARGMANGQTGVIAEVLNRQGFADARRDERRGFASAEDSQSTQRRATDSSISNNGFNTLSSFFDPQTRIFGHGGSQSSGQVSAPSQYSSYLGSAVQTAQGNQAAGLAQQQSVQDSYWNNVNREDSNYWSNVNRTDSNSNAAAQRKSSTTNAAIGAGAGILAYAALAFL